jgi:3-oxoadipate enol-lactonase
MTDSASPFRKVLQLEQQGSHIAYHISGAGPTLLLLHPVGLDSTWWMTYVAHLAANYRVIAVDLPGHGLSGSIHQPATLEDFAAQVAVVLRAEASHPVYVIGASMGGMVAQHLALQQQDLAGLILCATAGTFADELRPSLRERGTLARHGMEPVIQPTLDRWFSPEGRSGSIGRRCRNTLAANDSASWEASWEAISRLDTLERLKTLQTPTLVITGAADITTPPAASVALTQALPNARLDIVPDAWHMGVFEKAEPFLSAFTGFLEDQSHNEPARAG